MLKRFTKTNVNGETNQGGVYNFYNKKKERIYTGRASGNVGGKWGDSSDGGNFRYGLKHRLQSYMQKDDPKEHPTKVALRPKIEYYYAKEIQNKKDRRATEKRWKQGNKFNHYKSDGHRGH